MKDVLADFSVADGDPEVKGVMSRTQAGLLSPRCLFHAERDLYRALHKDGAEGEHVYW